MMVNDREIGDDQNKGWFEVRKKHRASSKNLTIKAGGSLEKVGSPSACYHGDSSGCELGAYGSPKEVADCASGSVVDARHSGSEYVVEDENKEYATMELEKVKFAGSECQAKLISKATESSNLNKVIKIKWGDLDDAALTLSESGNKCISTKEASHSIAFGSIEKHGNVRRFNDVDLDTPSCIPVLEECVNISPKGVENLPSGDLSLNEFSTKDKCAEVIEILNTTHCGSFDGPSDDIFAKSLEIQSGVDLVSNIVTLESSTSVAEGDTDPTFDRVSRPAHVLNFTELSGTNKSSPTTIAPQESSEFPCIASGTQTFSHSTDSAVTDYQKELRESVKVGGEFGESESGESKERFRERLWCFLFENLNRAVDELYLLCELECDMEQMDEATLVLEEATSDFRELKIRVGQFDIAKRPLCQTKEGSSMTVKADHRRPHALSWEVRRMTTSPHRANILSSSLEAFRKIQLERSNKFTDIIAKEMDHTKSGQEIPIHSAEDINISSNAKDPNLVVEKDAILSASTRKTNGEKKNSETAKGNKGYSVQNGRATLQGMPTYSASKYKRDPLLPVVEYQKQPLKKDKEPSESKAEKQLKGMDPWRSMDAWKEKRNWEDILKLPMRNSSRVSFPPGINRKSVERARVLHDKLMSPDKKKKSAIDLKREAEEKHARAMRIRNQLENERVQRLQRTSEKLNRVNEWQAVRSSKLREIMFARHQRSESLHEAYLAQVVRRAGDESSKVNEVRFITSLNEENKKLMLRQKLHDSEMRRAEKLEVIRTKQKEDTAKEEAVLERRKLLEAEKLQRLAETQRRKEEAQLRREEERKASSAAREAKAVEQLRRKEIRAKAQQEEAEMLAQKLAERLRESEQRRKYYLEQIREKASTDFRDQSSPLQRRAVNKEVQSKTMTGNNEDNTAVCSSDSALKIGDATQQQSLKRRIKKIRQRLMALKHDFTEPSVGAENAGVGYRAQMSAARIKIGRWLQELQRFRQARKEGAASIGLIVGDMVKFLDGKDLELHASRRAGVLDFISSALPASHTSKPDVCQVTLYLLRLIRVVLSLPANRGYFLAQNLLPPIIPMLSASLENYIKVAASSSIGNISSSSSKTINENSELIAEILEGFIWTVTIILGHAHVDDRQLQMQEALIELIVAYQVIHRLRDLFALYDRPQVEGSAFPPAILSSLTFLSVLTSRPGTVSSIDWECCISKAATTNRGQGSKVSNSSVYVNSSGDNRPPSPLCVSLESPANKSARSEKEKLAGVSPLNISEDKQPQNKDNGKVYSTFSASDVASVSERHVKALSDESQDISEDIDKCFIVHKDENMLVSEFIERSFDEPATDDNLCSKKAVSMKPPLAFLLSAITGTGLVSLLSLLTAVLLQANNKLSSEQGSYVLPSNFEEVATDVLKVLNNLANLDISVLQRMLAKPDLKVEFFHLMSFLLTHCTNKWKTANDQVGLLLLESLLLLGYFSLFHPENQAVLRWGKSPTILHKVCDLPFVFFSDPELMPILAGTLVAACYGCEQNRGVVQQELSTDMLLSLLNSCKQGLLSVQLDSSINDTSVLDSIESNQVVPDNRKSQGEIYVKSTRRNSKILTGKGSFSGGNIRISKIKGQRDCKTKTCEEWALMHNLPVLGSSSSFMLHRRFPTSFLDKSEEFFAAEASSQLE